MKRGEVWWVDLGEPRGSEPAFRRPVLVIQDDLLTGSALETVMVAPLTSNLQRSVAIGNVEVSSKQSGLPKTSVVLVCQVMTIDKTLFADQAGTLPQRVMADVDKGLALALSLNVGT